MSAIERSMSELLTVAAGFVDLCKQSSVLSHYLDWSLLMADLNRAGMGDLAEMLWQEQWDEAQDWIRSHGPDAWGK